MNITRWGDPTGPCFGTDQIDNQNAERNRPVKDGVLSPNSLLASLWIGNEMNPLNDPDAEERTRSFQVSLRSLLTAVSLPAAAIALVTFNALSYLHSRSVEFHVRRNWTGVRPWLWPEDVLGLFVLTWVLALIASGVAMFRLRNRTLKYQSRILAAVALVAMVVNAILCMGEAFSF